jgi:hypothetical protein
MRPKLFIQPLGDKEFHDCPCCGRCSRTVWGSIATAEHVVACYYVHWTVGQVQEFGANIDLVIGKWGEGASPSERYAVALEYRLLDNGPAVRVIDAGERLFAESDLAGRALLRDDVVGQPIAGDVFAYSDLVLAKDDRISEILGGWSFD